MNVDKKLVESVLSAALAPISETVFQAICGQNNPTANQTALLKERVLAALETNCLSLGQLCEVLGEPEYAVNSVLLTLINDGTVDYNPHRGIFFSRSVVVNPAEPNYDVEAIKSGIMRIAKPIQYRSSGYFSGGLGHKRAIVSSVLHDLVESGALECNNKGYRLASSNTPIPVWLEDKIFVALRDSADGRHGGVTTYDLAATLQVSPHAVRIVLDAMRNAKKVEYHAPPERWTLITPIDTPPKALETAEHVLELIKHHADGIADDVLFAHSNVADGVILTCLNELKESSKIVFDETSHKWFACIEPTQGTPIEWPKASIIIKPTVFVKLTGNYATVYAAMKTRSPLHKWSVPELAKVVADLDDDAVRACCVWLVKHCYVSVSYLDGIGSEITYKVHTCDLIIGAIMDNPNVSIAELMGHFPEHDSIEWYKLAFMALVDNGTVKLSISL